MPPSFSVRFDTASAVAGLDDLGRRGEIALRRALKRTAISVRTVMASEVASDIGIRVGTVRDEIKLRLNEQEGSATISASGARIPLIEFNARGPEPSRGTGRGVSYRIGKAASRGRNPKAFITTLRGGHRGVFARKGASVRRSQTGWSKNLPIVELKGPSLPHVFAKYIPLGIARAEEQLGKNLEHELQYALGQGGV